MANNNSALNFVGKKKPILPDIKEGMDLPIPDPTTTQQPDFVRRFGRTFGQKQIEQPSVLGKLQKGVQVGVAGIAETHGDFFQGLGKVTGSLPLQNIGADILRGTDRIKQKLPDTFEFTEEETKGVSGTFARAIASLIPSVAASVEAVGLTLLTGGTAAPLLGSVAAAAPAAQFSLAEYNRSLEDFKKKGIPEDKAKPAAFSKALFEGIPELLSNVVSFSSFGLFKPAVKNVLKNFLTKSAKTSLVEGGKKIGATTLTEVATEAVTAAGQANIDQSLGIEGLSPIEAAVESIGPSIAMSLMFAGGAKLLNTGRRAAVKKALTDEKAPPEIREQAVEEVVAEIETLDPELASLWRERALDSVAKGESIPIDINQIKAPPATIDEAIQEIESIKMKENFPHKGGDEITAIARTTGKDVMVSPKAAQSESNSSRKEVIETAKSSFTELENKIGTTIPELLQPSKKKALVGGEVRDIPTVDELTQSITGAVTTPEAGRLEVARGAEVSPTATALIVGERKGKIQIPTEIAPVGKEEVTVEGVTQAQAEKSFTQIREIQAKDSAVRTQKEKAILEQFESSPSKVIKSLSLPRKVPSKPITKEIEGKVRVEPKGAVKGQIKPVTPKQTSINRLGKKADLPTPKSKLGKAEKSLSKKVQGILNKSKTLTQGKKEGLQLINEFIRISKQKDNKEAVQAGESIKKILTAPTRPVTAKKPEVKKPVEPIEVPVKGNIITVESTLPKGIKVSPDLNYQTYDEFFNRIENALSKKDKKRVESILSSEMRNIIGEGSFSIGPVKANLQIRLGKHFNGLEADINRLWNKVKTDKKNTVAFSFCKDGFKV